MNKLVINTQEHLYLISPGDIVYCKSDNSYTEIFLIDGKKLIISKSLSNLAKTLEASMFIRVSQSYLINKTHIISVDKKKRSIEFINHSTIQFTTTMKELVGLISI